MTKKKIAKKIKVEKLDNHDRQLKYILVIIGIIIFFIFVTYLYVNSTYKFKFLGLNFEEVEISDANWYYTNVNIIQDTGESYNYELYLRNDPRDLNLSLEPVRYIRSNTTYITYSANFDNCSVVGMAPFLELGKFLGGIGVNAKSALADENLSLESGFPYVTCENTKNNTVILFESGEKTEVVQENNCYRVKVANCEFNKATEIFIISTIATARGYI